MATEPNRRATGSSETFAPAEIVADGPLDASPSATERRVASRRRASSRAAEGGRAEAAEGGRAEAAEGGRAEAAEGGRAEVGEGGRVHPANGLNELSGEEWLYFTKSVWSTAYPSELGHERRRAHGANKPPRLMARLIEFFTKPGELVLDPFAGVGGTLLGAAIARGPRRALGFEIEPRWVRIFETVVAEALAEQDRNGYLLADLGPADPGGPRRFDPSGIELRVGDALSLLPGLPDASVDFVATDPPYNVQLRQTMAGGPLAARFANRRTDYAMVTDDPADLANSPSYAVYLERMAHVFRELARVLRPGRYAVVIVRDAYQGGRYLFTAADLAAQADRAGLVPKGDLIWYQAGTRLRPYGYPRVFVPNIAHQHILVFRREARRTRLRPPDR